MSSPVGQRINATMLARLRDLSEPGGPDVLAELIGMYLADTPRFIDDLRRAIHNSDPEGVRNLAHMLKGSSSNMGAQRLETICCDLENLARAGSLEGAAGLLDAIHREFVCVRALLSAEQTK